MEENADAVGDWMVDFELVRRLQVGLLLYGFLSFFLVYSGVVIA